jgi:hypothetical protein
MFLDSEFVLELDAMASEGSRISMEINMGNDIHEHDDVKWEVVTVAEMIIVVRNEHSNSDAAENCFFFSE